jgi:adenylate cyclase class 2
MVECVDFLFSPADNRANASRPPAVDPSRVERHWVGVGQYNRNSGKHMPVEIEAKLKVDSFDGVLEKLRDRSATFAGDRVETNTFFDTEDRSLLALDKGLRLRVSRDVPTGQEQYILTYKGPRQHGSLKSRDEIEVTVGSPADAIALLECLGYSRMLSFEKKRQTWKLEGCTVELDQVPFLGCFIEIEGPREEAVLKVRDALGLSDLPMLKGSYVAMLATYLQERGEEQRDIKFDSETAGD